MPVFAFEVLSVEPHPNADSLFIHQVGSPQRERVQIIANARHEPGQIMAVATIGAHLKDGTKIKKARLRGVDSFGMFVEPVSEAPGTELTERYCEAPPPELAGSGNMIKWTSVELLHYVRRTLDGFAEVEGEGYEYPKIEYRAKIKLDGTNGGVQLLPNGDVLAQSRSRVLSLGDDNLGFAKWVQDNLSYFQALAKGEHIVIFGEWCGQGVQKRTAISKIDRRIFTVFAIQLGDHQKVTAKLEVEPARIQAMLPKHDDIFVLPWLEPKFSLDFADSEQLQSAAETLNQYVAEVEACDPWVKSVFGIEGLGEGVVLYPEAGDAVERDAYTPLLFKAKGEKHQVVKQKKPAQIDPEVAANIGQFTELFVTEARLEQGVQQACAGQLDMRRMGDFLQWFGQDVKKESSAELEASGLAWKDVSKAVTQKARDWYKSKALSV